MERRLNNLYQLLEQTALTSRSGIIIYPPGNVEDHGSRIAYCSLFHQAKRDAKSIHRINPNNSKVLLHFDEHGPNIQWFWATVVAGCVPVISPPLSKDPDQRRKHLLHLRQLLDDPIVLAQANTSSDFTSNEDFAVYCVEKLEAPTDGDPHRSAAEQDGSVFSCCDVANLRQPRDLAVLMLTSGYVHFGAFPFPSLRP